MYVTDLPIALTLPVPHPRVVFQKLEDGAVLFSPDTELYFGLNEVGAQVWQLLTPSQPTLDSVVGELRRKYPDAAEEMIRADVADLLAQLVREGLALAADASGGAGVAAP